MSVFYKLFSALCKLFPDSPLLGFIQEFKEMPFMGYLNFFVNVSTLVDMMALWCAALVAYKIAIVAYHFVMKLIK